MAALLIGAAPMSAPASAEAPRVSSPVSSPPSSPPSTPPSTAPPAPVEDGGQTESGGSTPTQQPPVTLPLIPVPVGCTAPPPPHVVFVGKVVDRDFRSAQFEIEQVRAGDPAPFARDDRVNVRYGLDAQYLDEGERYLVSAPVDPDLGLLVSRVTAPVENFGGDEVIGVSESDVNCPRFDDPLRTLHLDGTAIDAGLTDPFWRAKLRLLGALVVPVAVAFGVIFLLATVRLSVTGIYHGVVRR
jgi:hypothetical protein